MPFTRSSQSGSPVVDWSDSGVVALTGRPDGPVLMPPGRAATHARELISVLATATGTSIGLDGARLLGERAAITGLRRGGAVSAGRHCRLLRTADGWAAVSCARPGDADLIGALVGVNLDGADPWPALTRWAREHPGTELGDHAELLGLAAGPVRTRADRTVPGLPVTSDLRPPAATPWPGMTARPVAGLLVVDFSALWAGPLCAHLLGLAGARVVKVETPHRPDGARRGNPEFYALLHHGHESVVLDPGEPGGRRALAALVDAADIVIESSRPRALAGFGLDAARAVARGTSWLSITAAGRSSHRVGFGDDIAATAGLLAHDIDTNTPVFVGDAIADPLTGITAAALAASAPADGSGVLWDLSMTDVVTATLTDEPAAHLRRDGEQWIADTEEGPVPVADPTPRAPAGPAPESGADTAGVLGSLRIPVP
ncbi:CoA transferase [Nocardia sp. NPDC050718]|uniref:CoA transferase n=1 Tax=Nocardia sp. NPDC050718 TaxID=3155788 RepID=UPI0033F762C5